MTINFRRRLWLKQALAFALSNAISPLNRSLASQSQNIDDMIFGGGRYQTSHNAPFQYVLSKVQPQIGNIKTIATPFFPHGFALSRNAIAYVFEKIGKGAGVVNLRTMEWLETIPSISGRLFYGHGACHHDKNLLFSTETLANEQGAIGVRDSNTLQYLGDFPTFGANPHDCHLIDNGKVLLVTNGGGDQTSHLTPSICYIDVNSQKLLDRIEMSDHRFNTGHTVHVKNHNAIVVSAPRKGWGVDHLGAISVVNQNNKLQVINEPSHIVQNMYGEALSVALISDKDLFIVTHPTPGMVTIWQLSTNKLLKKLDLPHARGVVLTTNRQAVWISHDSQAHLTRINLKNLEIEADSKIINTFITGSHLVNWPI